MSGTSSEPTSLKKIRRFLTGLYEKRVLKQELIKPFPSQRIAEMYTLPYLSIKYIFFRSGTEILPLGTRISRFVQSRHYKDKEEKTETGSSFPIFSSVYGTAGEQRTTLVTLPVLEPWRRTSTPKF